jgi:hypothetical protein
LREKTGMISGDDPHHGQDHHVDLGVPEEPEHVLEEQRVAALVRLEEVRPRPAVEQEQRQARPRARAGR